MFSRRNKERCLRSACPSLFPHVRKQRVLLLNQPAPHLIPSPNLDPVLPERQKEAVADHHPQPPQDSQPQTDVLEVVVATGQQVP